MLAPVITKVKPLARKPLGTEVQVMRNTKSTWLLITRFIRDKPRTDSPHPLTSFGYIALIVVNEKFLKKLFKKRCKNIAIMKETFESDRRSV